MASSATRRPVVLVVEDEFLLRMNAAELIVEAGFEVVEAANADDAIAILEVAPRYPSAGPASSAPTAAASSMPTSMPRRTSSN
jgi:hypothetical protein